jgi:hypothetical protein
MLINAGGGRRSIYYKAHQKLDILKASVSIDIYQTSTFAIVGK